jgi:hypothetical protein
MRNRKMIKKSTKQKHQCFENISKIDKSFSRLTPHPPKRQMIEITKVRQDRKILMLILQT